MHHQLVQTNHATYQMAQQFPNNTEIPSIVVIGVPNQAALRDVMERLVRYNIRFAAFYEPDGDMGLSAISTIPLSKKQKYALSRYPLWEHKSISTHAGSSAGVQSAGMQISEAEGSSPSPRTNFSAQISFEGELQ